jgi:hypothetical protein
MDAKTQELRRTATIYTKHQAKPNNTTQDIGPTYRHKPAAAMMLAAAVRRGQFAIQPHTPSTAKPAGVSNG